MTHPDTLQITRAVVEQALEALENAYSGSIQGYHEAFDNLSAALQAQPTPTVGQAAAEPVCYQSRMRPLWGQSLWTEWSECSKGFYEDYKRTPINNDWEFASRALYTTTTPDAEAIRLALEALQKNLQSLVAGVTFDLTVAAIAALEKVKGPTP